MDMVNKIAYLLGGSKMPAKPANEAPLGSGMASQAAAILKSRPYQLHVQEMRAQGMEPLSPQEFAAQFNR